MTVTCRVSPTKKLFEANCARESGDGDGDGNGNGEGEGEGEEEGKERLLSVRRVT